MDLHLVFYFWFSDCLLPKLSFVLLVPQNTPTNLKFFINYKNVVWGGLDWYRCSFQCFTLCSWSFFDLYFHSLIVSMTFLWNNMVLTCKHWLGFYFLHFLSLLSYLYFILKLLSFTFILSSFFISSCFDFISFSLSSLEFSLSFWFHYFHQFSFIFI